VLSAAGAAITMLVEGAAAGMHLGQDELDGVRLGAFVSGAAAFFLAIPGLLMGMTAASHVRDSRGRLKGRGAAHAAVFLAVIAAVLALGVVRPRLETLNTHAREAGDVAKLFVQDLRERKLAPALETLSQPLHARLT